MAPRQHREAVRSRPRIRARAERGDQEDAGRAADLPDRPLPRQGDGAEPHGLPFRQQHLRADLEPQLHRPRADHRVGDAGRGTARRLLRDVGHAARHGAQSPVPARFADGDGAADLVRRGRRARRADQGPERHPDSVTGRSAGAVRARAIRRRHRRRTAVVRLSLRSERRSQFLHRNVRRAQAGARQLALGRRSVLPAHRQAHDRSA